MAYQTLVNFKNGAPGAVPKKSWYLLSHCVLANYLFAIDCNMIANATSFSYIVQAWSTP